MTPILIGITSGIFLILIFHFLKMFDKFIIYGLTLSAIGFLYVGFSWTNTTSLIITSIQAVFFFFISYFGIKKNLYLLGFGYFMHGLWDIVYPSFQSSNLIPPHYDLFCLSIDFTIGIYLIFYTILQNFKVEMQQILRTIQ